MGVRHLAVLSGGEQVANPRPLAADLRRLRRLSRQLARQRGPRAPDGTLRPPSAGWRRTQRKLARRHARVANLRTEALHQLTTSPHAGQRKVRSARDSLAFTVPQSEQVFDDAKNVPASTSRPPAHEHL